VPLPLIIFNYAGRLRAVEEGKRRETGKKRKEGGRGGRGREVSIFSIFAFFCPFLFSEGGLKRKERMPFL